jgi:hypothetical protein
MGAMKRLPRFRAKLSALVSRMDAALKQRAIDHAFMVHMSSLFDRLCADIETAKRSKTNLDDARKEYLRHYEYACLTHQEMMDHA